VCFCQTLHDWQPKSRAFFDADDIVTDLTIALEHSTDVLLGNTYALILYAKRKFAGRCQPRKNQNRTARTTELDRISEKIEKDLFERTAISDDIRQT